MGSDTVRNYGSHTGRPKVSKNIHRISGYRFLVICPSMAFLKAHGLRGDAKSISLAGEGKGLKKLEFFCHKQTVFVTLLGGRSMNHC